MIFGTATFLLIINVTTGNQLFEPDDNCDFHESVMIGQEITIYSPNWPGPYSPGMSCRWIYECPQMHICLLRCHDIKLPQSAECHIDQLLVSTAGSKKFDVATTHCGRADFKTKSTESRIAIALKSSKSSPGGRFRCKIIPEPAVGDAI